MPDKKLQYYQSELGFVFAVDEQNKVYDVEKDKSLKPSKIPLDVMWSGVDESELDALLNQYPYNK